MQASGIDRDSGDGLPCDFDRIHCQMAQATTKTGLRTYLLEVYPTEIDQCFASASAPATSGTKLSHS